MRFLAQLEQGVLDGDDLDDIHPDILSRYYGVEGPERRLHHGQTGAGHYDDDEDESPKDDIGSDSEETTSSSESSSMGKSKSSDCYDEPRSVTVSDVLGIGPKVSSSSSRVEVQRNRQWITGSS